MIPLWQLWLAGGMIHLMVSMSFLAWLDADVERLRQRLHQRGGHNIGYIVGYLDNLPSAWSVVSVFLMPIFGVWMVQSRWRTLRDATIDRLQLDQLIPGDEPARR